jgi:glycosyltransferase involved in cell wall biosynthesis
MPNPFISVLMPTYNQEMYIRKAIESVLLQSYTNFELVISDDASTDSTRYIVSDFMKLDSRIKYYRNDRNFGAAENYNISLQRAKSDSYWISISSDDWWDCRLLEKLVTEAERHPSVTITHCDAYRVDESGQIIGRYSDLWPQWSQTGVHRSIREMFLYGCLINNNCTLVRRDLQLILYSTKTLFDPTLKHAHDYHLWLQLLSRGATAYYVAEPLAFYRKHSAALTSPQTVIPRLREHIAIFREKLADVCPELENLRMEALLRNLKQLGFSLLATSQKEEALTVLSEAKQLAQGRQLDINTAKQVATLPLSPKFAAFTWVMLAALAQKVRRSK